MARKKIKNNSKGEGCSSSIVDSNKKELVVSNTWSNLTNDILLNIFNRLDDDELFWVTSAVCRSWQLVCWEKLFWVKLQGEEVLNLGMLADFCYDPEKDNYDLLKLALARVIRNIFDRNGDVFKDIPFWKSFDMLLPTHMSDNYLVYVAERTPKLEKLCLDMHGITGKGFSRSIRNWRLLEEVTMLSLSGCHATHIIQEMGINCGNLYELSIYSRSGLNRTRFCFDEFNSQLIADNLRFLRWSRISDCYINKCGLLILLSKCKQLEMLRLDTCIRALEDVKLTRRRGALNARPVKVIAEPLSVILQKCEDSDTEWLIDKVPRKHNVRSVISHLWNEVGDAPT